jgi:hypothetical protein
MFRQHCGKPFMSVQVDVVNNETHILRLPF